jgi:hypothetical protein
MPILGLTDKTASFPQIGVLRKGGEKKDERKPGPDLKHFRFDCDDEDANAAFRSVYGDEPRTIRIFVPYATVAENFEAWREEWTAGSLKHRCDGQTCARWLNGNAYSDKPKPCPGGCKPTGRLKVIIPELKRLAYVTVLTTSIHDIITIQSNLMALESAREDLRGIPMLLRRSPREISTPNGEGKRARREKWLISIEAQPSWVELQLTAQQRAALPGVNAPLALMPAPSGEDEDDEDYSDTQPSHLHMVPTQQAEAELMIDEETASVLAKMWAVWGLKDDQGQVKPLLPFLKRTKNVDDVKYLTLKQGKDLVVWLQERELAAQQKANTAVAEEPAKPSGLDQWQCGRAQAMAILTATNRLEATDVTADQWREELNAAYAEPGGAISRKDLTPEQAEGWLGLLNDWAALNEAKVKAA